MSSRDEKVVSKKPLKNKTKVFSSKAKSTKVKKETPKKSKKEVLAESIKKFNDLIKFARLKGWNLAADNLEFWFKNKNPKNYRNIPIKHFNDEDFILNHIKTEHVPLIIKGIEARIHAPEDELFPKSSAKLLGGRIVLKPKKNELKRINSTIIYYENSVYAPEENELYYALGGFTILSEVNISREEINIDGEISNIISVISWKCSIYDRYNWDKGKAVLVPLYGKIYDEELMSLEENGIGNDYDIFSNAWSVNYSEIGVNKEFSIE